ncbi:Uncharacterised protein [Mycobacteroides abscessus subsp. abscessus]|uniref:hypothetical protein n=1 Tax=Mycobacteroides abscessus TaxID=36809 RepID=UPI000929A419|nr:hypothetical protein [Mycobacteroides abscessus]SHT43405.1 Uncharacterised protein [Mycobacteroides abscessus subsp. abscessus]SLK74745.1 Uncharacterised protein [Mycobacteroides abscessus subsp. abscessus]
MSDVNTGPDAPENEQNGGADTATAKTSNNAPEAQPDDRNGYEDDDFGQADTFPRTYVEKLRTESAGYRDRAKQAEDRADKLARRLHAALVKANGTLVDPDALPFDLEHLDDDEKLSAAIEKLTDSKPWLKARKVAGDAGQGYRGSAETGVNLLELLRGNS